jgi:PAS domain S-box-containing protein
MDFRELKRPPAYSTSIAASDGIRAELPPDSPTTSSYSLSPKRSKRPIALPVDDADGMFMHAPVSLWEEDFSEVKRRFDQLRANGVEDLRKHFRKHPEEVLSLARMVRITQVNEETLKLYDAAGPAEFREGLSLIFNKDSFEIFKEEVIAFWKGRTAFSSEAVNVTLAGISKNILLQASIPPGYERTWARVYIAITDITAIKESMGGIADSEQKFRSVFDTLQTAIVLLDATSGVIVEANKSAKRLFGASNGELTGMHLADLVPGTQQDKVHMLLSNKSERPDTAGPILHVHQRGNGAIPVHAAANTIEIGDASIVVVSFTPKDETTPARSSGRKTRDPYIALGKKLTQREREILRLICSGKTSRSIADQLCISDKTVETHRTRIMQKLDTHCVADLVRFAMTSGLAHLQ